MTTYEFTVKTLVEDESDRPDFAALFYQARKQLAVQLLDEDADYTVSQT